MNYCILIYKVAVGQDTGLQFGNVQQPDEWFQNITILFNVIHVII